MKTKLSVLLFLFVVMGLLTQAQSKKDLEADLATCTTLKDSIQSELTGLTANYDSINSAYLAYDTMYNAVKEKVFMYDFDPVKISDLIDSLRTGRDEAFSEITAALNDSISILAEENAKLKETVEGKETGEENEVISELKQLKDLLDAGILTQDEFNAKKAVLLEKL